MNHVIESLRFLTTARTTICEYMDNIPTEDYQIFRDFITNEATDYEIMHILTREMLPESKYNPFDEDQVWKEFKKFIIKNRNVFTEVLGRTITDTMIFEMAPVFDYGLSSQKPVLEHLMNTGYISSLLEGETASMETKRRKEEERVDAALKKAGEQQQAVNDRTKRLQAQNRDLETPAKTQASSGSFQDSTFGTKAKGVASNVAWKAHDIATAAGKGIKQGSKAAYKFAKTNPGVGVIGGLAALAALTYGAKKIYDNYMSKAAKACKGAPDKSACMAKYKAQAQKAKVSKMQQGISACKGDPKCIEKAKAKISKEKSKI